MARLTPRQTEHVHRIRYTTVGGHDCRFVLEDPDGREIEHGPCGMALAKLIVDDLRLPVRHDYDLTLDNCESHRVSRVRN
jgi:hypothetical protein